MSKSIPVKAAEEFAKTQGLKQVIVFGWDGTNTHCVSYGESLEDCAQAAAGANKLKKSLGWPESLLAEPPRIKSLLKKVAELEAQLKDK